MGPEKEIYGTYDLGVQSEKTKPTLVTKPTSTQPTESTSLPEIYQMRDFDTNAWVAAVLKDRYGTDGSNRDFRRLNRYLSSDDGLKALALAKEAHKKLEMSRWLDSLKNYLKAFATVKPVETTNTVEKLLLVAAPTRLQPTWISTNAKMQPGLDSYKIESGNTLGQIVATYNKLNGTKLTWQDVAKWNGVDEKKLKIGQVINFKPNETTTPEATNVSSNTSTPQVNLNPESTVSSTPTSTDRRTQDREEFDRRMIERGFVFDETTGMYRKPKTASTTTTTNLPDSTLVSQVDSGHVASPDSLLLNSPDSVSISSKSPENTIQYPRNFTWTGLYFNYPTEDFMREMNLYKDYLRSVLPEKISSNKRGGTMNRINYFQQGGAAPAAQTGQADAFMQAILQGDPEAIQQLIQLANDGHQEASQLVLTILLEDKKGNQNVAKAAQVIKQLMQQASVHKYGSKLNYIRSLKYAKGGKTCPACEQKVEMKKCGGKKAKKRYFGGYL